MAVVSVIVNKPKHKILAAFLGLLRFSASEFNYKLGPLFMGQDKNSLDWFGWSLVGISIDTDRSDMLKDIDVWLAA